MDDRKERLSPKRHQSLVFYGNRGLNIQEIRTTVRDKFEDFIRLFDEHSERPAAQTQQKSTQVSLLQPSPPPPPRDTRRCLPKNFSQTVQWIVAMVSTVLIITTGNN